MEVIYDFVKNISLVFFVVPPTVFIFSVTLLGTAIEKSQNEASSTIQKNSENTNDEIEQLEKKIAAAKKDGNTDSICDNLEKLKKDKSETDKKIKKIKDKYSSINLLNTCIYPFFCLGIAILGAQIGLILINKNLDSFLTNIFLIISVVILLFIGFYKVYKALSLVQEISGNKKENEFFEKTKEAIKLALIEDRESSQSDVKISFVDKVFPLNLNVSTELEIKFRTTLVKGTILNNVSIWFFVPDGFELIRPSEKDSWRQGSDYNPPNIRTVKIEIGNLSIGPYISGSIKIKTPEIKGDNKIKYKVYADGYSGSAEYIDLVVI